MALDTNSSHSANRINILPCPWRNWNSYSSKITQFKSCSGIQNQPWLMPNIVLSNSSPSATSQVSLRFLEKRREIAIGSQNTWGLPRPPKMPGCFWKALAPNPITRERKVHSSAAPSAVLCVFGLRGRLPATWSISTCPSTQRHRERTRPFLKEGKECCLSPSPWMSRPVDPSTGSISVYELGGCVFIEQILYLHIPLSLKAIKVAPEWQGPCFQNL